MNIASVKAQIPDGFELACDEMRPPRAGEWFVASEKCIAYRCEHPFTSSRIIIRKAWQWPAGFDGVAAMARTPGGVVVAYSSIPRANGDGWDFDHKASHIAEWMHTNLNFPHPDRWQDSLRINPNFKQ